MVHQTGGMLVYYELDKDLGDPNKGIKAFRQIVSLAGLRKRARYESVGR